MLRAGGASGEACTVCVCDTPYRFELGVKVLETVLVQLSEFGNERSIFVLVVVLRDLPTTLGLRARGEWHSARYKSERRT